MAGGGCASQAKIREQQHAAFLAGQNAALRQEQEQFPSVTVVGPVQNPRVPWVDGLTLAQAIATADYLDPGTPERISITRNGQTATLDPDVLLRGTDIPLEPGDVIEIQPP